MRVRFLFILCLLWQSMLATTYYVSPTGSHKNNGTSLATPMLSVLQAVAKAKAGDIVYLRSGTYTCDSTINLAESGTSANPITFAVYPADLTSADARPILNFSNMPLLNTNQGIILTGGYWIIKGLRIRGAGDNGMLVQNASATGNLIEFCDFFENRDAGFQIRKSASNNRILNCDSYNNADMGTGSTTNGGNADGFAPKLDLGENIYFINCRAWGNSDDGWDGYLKCLEAKLPDNMTTYLENCWAFNNGYYWKDGSTTGDMNGNGIKMGGSASKNQAHNFVVKNCLAYNNKSKGFDQNNNAGSMTLYNCTSVQNKGKDYALNSSGVTYAAGSAFKVINCVAYGTTGTDFKSGTTLTTNNFSTAAGDYASIDASKLASARDASGNLPSITYMHPATGSKLIDAGTDVGIPFNGAKPDLGYWEVGTISNIAPSVSITSPANNATFIAPASLAITATATDSDGSIAKVEFYNGTTLLGTGTASGSTYSYTWSSVAAGTYIITAKAYDNLGATTVSLPITIVVSATSVPTLTSTNNEIQTVTSGSAIASIVFTWGGSATDVTYTTLPAGLTATKNASNKTLTVSGTPTASGTFTVTTSGGTPAAKIDASISITTAVPTLTSTNNVIQTVTSGSAIASIVFTWGGSATDVSYTTLPAGLTATKNANSKTLTVSGTPTASGTFTVTTSGGSPAAKIDASISISTTPPISTCDLTLDGFASVSGDGITKTTGGTGGAETTVTNEADLTAWVSAAEKKTTARILYISGKIEAASSTVLTIKNGANITIIGINGGELKNIGLNIRDYNNVIVQNLTIHEVAYPNDALTLDNVNHGWVTHCDFYSKIGSGITYDTYDGMLDVKNGSRYVTISWNRIHDHMKTLLFGHTDNANSQAIDQNIRVSLHHNYFFNTDGRNPSLRWGAVHSYNNYFNGITDYGIAVRRYAHAKLENNYYKNVKTPIATDKFIVEVGDDGVVCESGCIFDACGANSITKTDCSWWNATNLPYSYTPTPTANVPLLVESSAGVCSVTYNIQPTVKITAPADNATFPSSSNIAFTVSAADADGTVAKVVYFTKKEDKYTILSTLTSAPFNFTWSSVAAGTYSVFAYVYDNTGAFSVSNCVNLTVGGTVPTITQSISLIKGWNLVSFNVVPSDASIATLFKNLDVQEIKDMNSFWRKGQDAAFNSLTTLNAGSGYLVNMNVAGTLSVTGTPVETQNFASLQGNGWNLIGCPYQTATVFTTNFNTTNCSVIKNFEGFWIPNGTANSLQNMEVGKGYFIKK